MELAAVNSFDSTLAIKYLASEFDREPEYSKIIKMYLTSGLVSVETIENRKRLCAVCSVSFFVHSISEGKVLLTTEQQLFSTFILLAQ